MVGEIVRRVLDHTDSNRSELACLPESGARLAGMHSFGDRRPVRNAEGNIVDVQVGSSLLGVGELFGNVRRSSGSNVTWRLRDPGSIAGRRLLDGRWPDLDPGGAA